MLHKCANPTCPSLFRSLSHGKLFLVETDYSSAVISAIAPLGRRERAARRMERYWLCDGCSSILTLTFQRGRGMVTVPLPDRRVVSPGAHLTQKQPSMPEYRADLKGVS